MSLVVQKFGGSSVATAERIMAAARRAIRAKHAGSQVIVVVSARGDWAPIFRWRLLLGRGDLTISLAGGFEELLEFFCALANLASKSATWSRRSATCCRQASQAGQSVQGYFTIFEVK